MGWASSSNRGVHRAFKASGRTKKASGLNWTWSIESLMIGAASSSTRGVVFPFLAALDTGHWTFLLATYPSANPLHLESSITLPDADDDLAPEDTFQIVASGDPESLNGPSMPRFGLANLLIRAEHLAFKVLGVICVSISLFGT